MRNTIEHPKIQHQNIIHSPRRLYYWIVGESDATGRRMIYGYRNTESEAKQIANRIRNAVCRVIPLETRDDKEASRQIRAMVLDETQSIDEAFKRFRHIDDV